MSNQAVLFANSDPNPLVYEADGADAGEDPVFVAGCAYQVPVFWLFCFDPEDLTLAPSSEDDSRIPTLTAPIQRVKARLAEREKRARTLFPEHASVLAEWVAALATVEAPYLKAEMGEIWCLYSDDDVFHGQLTDALAWVAGRSEYGLDELLSLAGITRYDSRTGKLSFDEKQECAEKFLYGWLELRRRRSRTRREK